eukprot:TRINITY_DN8907_c0_g2_i1.p1 TRINITY_DN8907_c0_g2~~TRINITY_DN8907_c0_g2_i1.p1  ORF type:complete len:649 (+),score=138.90 TRINITY_DN8907_c0_g2_i1:152-2098(+)
MSEDIPMDGNHVIEEEDHTIGLLCLEDLAKQVLLRREMKEVNDNECAMVAGVVSMLVGSSPPPLRRYSSTELIPLLSSAEDVGIVIEQSKAKLEEYLQSLSSSSSSGNKKKPSNRNRYRVEQPLWTFSDLKEMGLTEGSLSILSEEIKIGKASKDPSLKEQVASPIKEKRNRDEDLTSPKKKAQIDPKIKTPLSTKKDKNKNQGDISGMKSMLSRFVVKKKIEPKTTEESFWWPYIIKTDASYVSQQLDIIMGTNASAEESDAETKDYRIQTDQNVTTTIKVAVPSLSMASADGQIDHDALLESMKSQFSKTTTNMLHPLVTKGGPPVELIAYKDIANEGVQYVGSAPDPTPQMAGVWPVGEPMPRDDEEIDYGETYSEANDDDSCSGSSLGVDEISQESGGSGNSSLFESESDIEDPDTPMVATNKITISGPAKATPVKNMISISDDELGRLVPSFYNTAMSKILRISAQDYAYHTYADWMGNHRLRCSAIPDHISMNEPVFFDLPEPAQGAGLKESTHKQRSVWDTPSTSELVRLVHFSTHKAPYLVESFREKYPTFTKSSVNNKLKEISHRENKYWVVRPNLIDHLGLTSEMEGRKPLEPEAAPVKRPKKAPSPKHKSKIVTRSQSMLAKLQKRVGDKKKDPVKQ